MESVYQLLLKKRELSGGLITQTPGELVKMEIVGYVPYSIEHDNLSVCTIFDVGRDVIIGSNKVCFTQYQQMPDEYDYKSKTFLANLKKNFFVSPIVNTIYLDKEEEVLVTPHLRILKYFPSDINSNLIMYYKFWNTNSRYLDRAEGALTEIPAFSLDENRNLHYKTEATDFVCYKNRAGGQVVVAISDAFLCLCSYFSPITGCLEYILKSPKDIDPVLK